MYSDLDEYHLFVKYVLALDNILSIRKAYMDIHDKVFSFREEIKYKRLKFYESIVAVLEDDLPIIHLFSSKKNKQYVQLFHLFKEDFLKGITHNSLVKLDSRFNAIPDFHVFDKYHSSKHAIFMKNHCSKEFFKPKTQKKLELVWLDFFNNNEDCFTYFLPPYIDEIVRTSPQYKSTLSFDEQLVISMNDLFMQNRKLPSGVDFRELKEFFNRRILLKQFDNNTTYQGNEVLHSYSIYPQYYFSSSDHNHPTIDDYMVKITGYLNNINLLYDFFYPYYKDSLDNLSIVKKSNSNVALDEAFQCDYFAYALWKSIQFEDSYFKKKEGILDNEYLSDLMSHLSIIITEHNDPVLMEKLTYYRNLK